MAKTRDITFTRKKPTAAIKKALRRAGREALEQTFTKDKLEAQRKRMQARELRAAAVTNERLAALGRAVRRAASRADRSLADAMQAIAVRFGMVVTPAAERQRERLELAQLRTDLASRETEIQTLRGELELAGFRTPGATSHVGNGGVLEHVGEGL